MDSKVEVLEIVRQWHVLALLLVLVGCQVSPVEPAPTVREPSRPAGPIVSTPVGVECPRSDVVVIQRLPDGCVPWMIKP